MRRVRDYVVILMIIFGNPAFGTVSAQEPVIEMDPERATAAVAPVGVTLGGMPDLEPLALVPEILEAEGVQTDLAPVVLPVPALPRETVEESIGVSGEQVFFNATLGGGSVNSVLGSINVFRIGEGPEFRIGYDHRASDGFNFEGPGSGYFRQYNNLDSWLHLGDEERLGFEAELGYRDERFGLQRKPEYYSAETRELSGRLVAEYNWDARSSTSLSLSLEELSRVLALSTFSDEDGPPIESQRERHYWIEPVLSARIEWPRLTLASSIDYSGRFTGGVELGSSSTAGISLRIEGVPVDGLTLTGIGATRYRFDDQPYFPVELGLEYSFRDRWTMRLGGGYRVAEQTYGQIWRDYPVSVIPEDADDPAPIDQILFSEADVILNVVPGLLQLNAGGGWFVHNDRLITGAYDVDRSEYPVRIDTFERITTRGGISITPTERLRLGFDWNGEWADMDTGVPQQTVAVGIRSDWSRFVGEFSAEVPLDEGGLVLPLVGGSIRYGIARDVELRLFVTDILAPVEEDGRTRRGVPPTDEDPFIEPGFEMGAAIRVSF